MKETVRVNLHRLTSGRTRSLTLPSRVPISVYGCGGPRDFIVVDLCFLRKLHFSSWSWSWFLLRRRQPSVLPLPTSERRRHTKHGSHRSPTPWPDHREIDSGQGTDVGWPVCVVPGQASQLGRHSGSSRVARLRGLRVEQPLLWNRAAATVAGREVGKGEIKAGPGTCPSAGYDPQVP